MGVFSAKLTESKVAGSAGGVLQMRAVAPGSMTVETKNSQNDESAALWPASKGKLAEQTRPH